MDLVRRRLDGKSGNAFRHDPLRDAMSRSFTFALAGLVTVSGVCFGQTTDPGSSPVLQHAADTKSDADAKRDPSSLQQSFSTYVIGPDDAIQVTVWKEPTLSGTMSVRPDGMISIPLIGDIQASGMTPMRLSGNIRTQLQRYITNPNVSVSVVTVNSKRVYFIGEVQHTGPLAITPGMNVLQAVAAAGGLTPYANSKHIYILRDVEGRHQKIVFDYKKAVRTGDLQGVTIVAGDTVVVP